jgi:rubrerythrin
MADKAASLKVLSQALRLEQDGKAFYVKAAEETQDAKGKALFLSLADDEVMHAQMIQRQLHALEGDGKYVLLPDLKAQPIDLNTRLFPPDKVAEKTGVNPSDIDALHVALDNEIQSYELYASAAKQATDAAAKQLYAWLASAETTHFNLLMSNYESIVSLGGWV